MSRVYVGNLDPRVTERELEDEFRIYGVLRRLIFYVFILKVLAHMIIGVNVVTNTVIVIYYKSLKIYHLITFVSLQIHKKFQSVFCVGVECFFLTHFLSLFYGHRKGLERNSHCF